MKTIRCCSIAILFISIILIVSCTFGTSNIEEGDVMTIDVSALRKTEIGGFRVYQTINVHNGVKKVNISNLLNTVPTLIFSSNPSKNSSSIFSSLGNGIYIFSEGSSFSFNPTDIGLSTGGRFSLATLTYKTYISSFLENRSEARFNPTSPVPAISGNSAPLYLGLFEINTKNIPDLADVNISYVSENPTSESETTPAYHVVWSLFDGSSFSPIKLNSTRENFDLSAYKDNTIYLILTVEMNDYSVSPNGYLVITSGEIPAENPEETTPVI